VFARPIAIVGATTPGSGTGLVENTTIDGIKARGRNPGSFQPGLSLLRGLLQTLPAAVFLSVVAGGGSP
jgi:hypothetical protein